MSRNEEGSFLVEILIASAILLVIAATAVSQLTSLTNIKVQTETRDRGLILANGLHENMQAAGCGFDVSNVNNSGVAASNELETQKPWARVSTCAFKALANAKANGAAVDEDGNFQIGATLAQAAAFCNSYAGGLCELGDQEFDREINLNLDNRKIKFHVTINYWFEKTGQTNSDTACVGTIDSTVKQPDVIVRKVNISWPNSSKASGKEDITVVKRQNIPADSIEFSSSARVGVYSNAAGTVAMYPTTAGANIIQVTRLKKTTVSIGTTVKGGANCVWFPYINKDLVPQFSVNGGGRSVPSLSSTLALNNKAL